MKKIIFKYISNLLLLIYSLFLFVTNINYENKLLVILFFLGFLYFVIKFIILNLFIIKKEKIYIKINIFFNLIAFLLIAGFGIYISRSVYYDYIYIGYSIFGIFSVIIIYEIYKLYKNNFNLNILDNFDKNKFVKNNLIFLGIIFILLFFYTRHEKYIIPENYFNGKINYNGKFQEIESIKYFDDEKYSNIKGKINNDNTFEFASNLNNEDIEFIKNIYENTKGTLDLDENKNYTYSKLIGLSRLYKIVANYYYQKGDTNKTIEIYNDLINKADELTEGNNSLISILVFTSIERGIILELEKNNYDENTNSKIVKNLKNIDGKQLFKYGITGEYLNVLYFINKELPNIPLLYDKKSYENLMNYKFYYIIENEGKSFDYKINYLKSNSIGYFLFTANQASYESQFEKMIKLENDIKSLKEKYN